MKTKIEWIVIKILYWYFSKRIKNDIYSVVFPFRVNKDPVRVSFTNYKKKREFEINKSENNINLDGHELITGNVYFCNQMQIIFRHFNDMKMTSCILEDGTFRSDFRLYVPALSGIRCADMDQIKMLEIFEKQEWNRRIAQNN